MSAEAFVGGADAASFGESQEFEVWDAHGPSVLMLIVFWLFIGAGIRSLPLCLQRLLPYTVIVLLAGCVLGYLASRCTSDGFLCFPYTVLTEKGLSFGMSPTMLQLTVLPPLIFAELFHTDIYMFRRVLGQALVLAFPGVLLSAFLMCAFVVYLLPRYFDWNTGMMFGAMLAASDPVAVLAGMKELGADPRLATIISGESIMNDGCAVVLFTLFYRVAFHGQGLTAGGVAAFAAAQTVGSAALGGCFLLGALLALRVYRKEAAVLLTATIAVPYMCFYTATRVGTSGILALIPLSLGLRLFSRSFLSGHLEQASHTVWELIEFLANTFVFLLSGVIMVIDLRQSRITGADVVDLLYIYLASSAIRGLTVLAFFPVLRRMGLGFSVADAVVTWWGGLRGAVGLSIAMIVHFSAGVGHPLEQTGVRFMFHMGGVYFLTTVVNATLSSPLVRLLKLDTKPPARIHAMLEVSAECCRHAADAALAPQQSGAAAGAAVAAAARVREVSAKYEALAHAALREAPPSPRGMTIGMTMLRTSSDGAFEENAQAEEEATPRAAKPGADLDDGERRRVLRACERRYQAYFEAGAIGQAACLALDHAARGAACRRGGARLQRWGALERLCSGLLRCSEFPLGLGALAEQVASEIAWGFREAQAAARATLPPGCSATVAAEVAAEAAGVDAFLAALASRGGGRGALRRAGVRLLAAEAQREALRRIGQAVEDGSLHEEEAAVLEAMASDLAEAIAEDCPGSSAGASGTAGALDGVR